MLGTMNRKPYLLIGDTKGNNMNYDLMDAYDLAELGTLELFIKKFDRKLLNKRNKYGFSLLHESLSGHKWDIAEFLINEGIDINLKDSGGNTALHYLCNNNSMDYDALLKLIKMLLDKGANINMQNKKGHTPLINATAKSNGQWDMGHIVEDINKPNIYAREYDKYLSGEITEDTFLEWYRTAKNYEPQLPRYNRGLKEKK